MEEILRMEHITKRFGDVFANRDVNLDVRRGEVHTLLGENGAGKSTLMRILVTVLAPSAGTVRVCGFDARTQGDQVRGRIGYLPQELTMYPSLTVFEFVRYMAELKGVRDRGAAAAALAQLGMEPKITQLSAARSKPAGGLHLMLGQNPVWIITGHREALV